MFSRILIYLKNYDWILFFSTVLLLCFGLAEIYSIALSKETDLINFKKQVIFIIIGLSLLFILSFIDYHNIRNSANYLYIFSILLLLSVLQFGKVIRGTRGWFDFGLFNFQPVEFVKIILIVYLARYFSTTAINIKPIKHLILTGIGTSILVLLVMKQPDFGSSLILLSIWGMLIILSGFNKKYLAVIAVMIMLGMASGWFFFFKDYQRQRIMTFLNPTKYSMDEGYNVTQAMIAVGSGGIMGRGIGFGSQSQLKFLPEAQTDFIFAVISEELGFFGVFLIMSFFTIFFLRIVKATKQINNDFGIYFLLGAGCLIFIQMFINIGMNIGLVPVVGISLPFLSYGGSSIVSSLALVGIIESIILRSKLKY